MCSAWYNRSWHCTDLHCTAPHGAALICSVLLCVALCCSERYRGFAFAARTIASMVRNCRGHLCICVYVCVCMYEGVDDS